MANRVILGPDYGFLVSRPGKNVLAAGIDDLNFSGNRPLLQVVQRGTVVIDPAGGAPSVGGWYYTNVGIVDQGFLPLVILDGRTIAQGSAMRHLSTNVIQLAGSSPIGGGSFVISYIVTNQRFV